MRLIVLDTETTGLRVEEGHRLIEVGCIELVNRQVSNDHLHVLLNPERDIDEGATAVHGFTWESLKEKPRFSDIAHQLIEFIRGATLIIHNAPFDLGFLDAELTRLGQPKVQVLAHQVIDSLAMARELHPGQRNSLDALCQRYGIANGHRVLHGALLDAELLADVYLAMTRGQDCLEITDQEHPDTAFGSLKEIGVDRLVVRHASPLELSAHEQYLAEMAAKRH